MVDGRESLVGIFRSIAMTRKMFGYCQYSVIFQSFGVGNSFTCNIFWIGTKGTCSDDGVLRIAVDVDSRCKIDMNAHFATLSGYFFSVEVKQRIVCNGAQHHIFGKIGGIAQPHRESPFGICGNKKRRFGYALGIIDKLGLLR